jgi:hypothetical protein
MTARRLGTATSVLAFVALTAGCGLSREVAGPAPAGTPQVTGTVTRAGVALQAMKVKLYDDLEQVQADSTVTDAAGAYGFNGVGAGHWMVKVSPTLDSDLGYVRFFFDVTAAGQAVVIPPFDVDKRGFDLAVPADAARLPRPTFSSPLTFQWTAYQGTYLWSSARLDDSLGVLAWASPQGTQAQAAWNGLGNQPPYTGGAVPAGRYSWRVKLRLPNGVQAASRVRALVLD